MADVAIAGAAVSLRISVWRCPLDLSRFALFFAS